MVRPADDPYWIEYFIIAGPYTMEDVSFLTLERIEHDMYEYWMPDITCMLDKTALSEARRLLDYSERLIDAFGTCGDTVSPVMVISNRFEEEFEPFIIFVPRHKYIERLYK